MPGCCAYGCSNKSSDGFKLYRFPSVLKNKHRRNVWIQRVRRKNWIPSDGAKLCEVHFTSDQFEQNRKDNRRLLKQSAIPSIFCHSIYLPAPKQKKPTSYIKRKDSSIDNSAGTQQNQEHFDHSYVLVSTVSDSKNQSSPTTTTCEVLESQLNDSEASATTTDEVLESQLNDAANFENQDFSSTTSDGALHLINPNAANFENQDSSSTISDGAFHLINPNAQAQSIPRDGEKLLVLTRKLKLAYKKIARLTSENRTLQAQYKKMFNDDQIYYMKTGSFSGIKWSDETVQKALHIKLACGSRGYNVLLDMGYPLPSERTLQRREKALTVDPSIK